MARIEVGRRRRRRPTFFSQHPFISYLLIAAAILFIFNISLLLPQQIGAIFYTIEHFFIRFFLLPITMHRITLFAILFVTAAIGYFIFPVVYIPWTEDIFIYRSSYSDGMLRYFKTLSGKTIAMNEEWLRKKWLKYTLIGQVGNISEKNGIIVYESKSLEVTKAIIEQEHIASILEALDAREYDIANGKIIPAELYDALIEFLKRGREERQ